MADESSELAEEELLLRHKKEKKDLQGEIQRLKHSIPKGDKKKKKDVTVQIAMLEAKLDERHEKEFLDFKNSQVSAVANDVSKLCTDDASDLAEHGHHDTQDNVQGAAQHPKKLSKAQKRRDKKAAAERDRDERIRQAEIENIDAPRNVELRRLKEILRKRKLKIFEIPSDGNCLYSAIEHQLQRTGIQSSVDSLRHQTAEHMRSHCDEFLPFLSKPHTGDPYTPEEYNEYCIQLETTPAWGGQLEIRALANVLRIPIEVIQADAPVIVTGEEYDQEPLVLTYHRHMYGLGEHYNAVTSRTAEDEEEDDVPEAAPS